MSMVICFLQINLASWPTKITRSDMLPKKAKV